MRGVALFHETVEAAMPERLRTNHERIWLEPPCADLKEEGRMWCKDDVWGTCEECGEKAVEYIRLDLAIAGGFKEKN